MSEIIPEFENEVVAVLTCDATSCDAPLKLGAAGFEYAVLHGEEGRSQLAGAGEPKKMSEYLHRITDAFADQQRVKDELDEALANDKLVISVEANEDRQAEVAAILDKHEGEYIWYFGDWSYRKLGSN